MSLKRLSDSDDDRHNPLIGLYFLIRSANQGKEWKVSYVHTVECGVHNAAMWHIAGVSCTYLMMPYAHFLRFYGFYNDHIVMVPCWYTGWRQVHRIYILDTMFVTRKKDLQIRTLLCLAVEGTRWQSPCLATLLRHIPPYWHDDSAFNEPSLKAKKATLHTYWQGILTSRREGFMANGHLSRLKLTHRYYWFSCLVNSARRRFALVAPISIAFLRTCSVLR